MKVKTLLVGYICGFIFTWTMWVILPLVLGYSDKMYSLTQSKTQAKILQQSLIVGALFAAMYGVIGYFSQRNRKKEELTNAMIEYFKSHAKKEESE